MPKKKYVKEWLGEDDGETNTQNCVTRGRRKEDQREVESDATRR
jgi:hypothetical protein